MEQRNNRRAFDRRVSLVLKKCVESLDRAKMGQKKTVNWTLLEWMHMKRKEEIKSGINEKIKPSDSLGQKRKECPDSYEDQSFICHKKRGERAESLVIDGVSHVESNAVLKKREHVEPSANDSNSHKRTTERTDLFISDISANLQERAKKVTLHTSNIRKWSSAVGTMRTLRRYIKNEVTEPNELLIGYMLSIDFHLLQAMYKFIRMMLPGTSEISELDSLTKHKILIVMDAIELWDRKRKKLSVPDFVNDLFAHVSSIEGFIKMFLTKTSNDSNVEPVILALMAHTFGLKIESEWKAEQMRPKYRPKNFSIS